MKKAIAVHAVAVAAASMFLALPARAACENDVDCKAGRVCRGGECVETPADAPVCTKDVECTGDRVCEGGHCVAPKPPAPAAALVATPNGASEPPAAAATMGATPAPAAATSPDPVLRSGFIVYPKLGVLVSGSGDFTTTDEYSGDTTQRGEERSVGVDDKSGFGVGVDFLGAPSPTFRVGGGLLWLPSSAVSMGGKNLDAGHQVAVLGILEPALPVSPTTAVLLRAQAGLSLLIPGGDVADEIDDKKGDCSKDTAEGDPKCSVYGGPGLGFTVGGGAGLVTAVGKTRLRADFLVQYLDQGAWHYEHTHRAVGAQGEYTHEVAYSVSGTRIWLMAGVEL